MAIAADATSIGSVATFRLSLCLRAAIIAAAFALRSGPHQPVDVAAQEIPSAESGPRDGQQQRALLVAVA